MGRGEGVVHPVLGVVVKVLQDAAQHGVSVKLFLSFTRRDGWRGCWGWRGLGREERDTHSSDTNRMNQGLGINALRTIKKIKSMNFVIAAH